MSDLGRLFRLSIDGPKPLENFTTVALSIAISHDDRPIKQALAAIDWTFRDDEGRPAVGGLDIAAADVASVTADTQSTLWPRDGCTLGYLDLVLTLRDTEKRECVVWVEVKVDAWESGSQLDNYRAHAALLPSPPTIITLGRTRVSERVPALRWSDVVTAIDLVTDPHYTWVSLREFLVDEQIVRPPVAAEPIDVGPCIDVVVAMNRRIREVWPGQGTSLAWIEGALRKALTASCRPRQDVVTTGGPLLYGLMANGDTWEWRLVVTARKNYDKIPVHPQQLLRDAELGGLHGDWVRHTQGLDVLERSVSSQALTSHDEIVAWFDKGLRQLHDARILDRYLADLACKRGTDGSTRPSKGSDGGA